MADYTQAATTAKNLIGLFSGDTAITFFTVLHTTTTTDTTTAHGLGGAPDFVFLSSSGTDDQAAASSGLGWTANATTLTLTNETAEGPARTISVIAGNLA